MMGSASSFGCRISIISHGGEGWQSPDRLEDTGQLRGSGGRLASIQCSQAAGLGLVYRGLFILLFQQIFREVYRPKMVRMAPV